MGTITERKNRYTAQIRIKRGGKIVHTESQTFDRRPAAAAWLKRRETELAAPGALVRGEDPLLSDVIERYLATNVKQMGRSKIYCLRLIQAHDVGHLRCSELTSDAISALAIEFSKSRQAVTVGTYISHLGAVLAVARPVWRCPIDPKAMEGARAALDKLGITGRSQRRDRRPTLDELDRLMAYFGGARLRRGSANMQEVIAFAIYSTRRQDEICRIRWEDLDEDGSRIMVRDMKNPDGAASNDVQCELTPEALAIIRAQPRVSDRIFPYNADTVCAAFTRACAILGIPDLRFHDLRHEGISRLFEMGRNIPQVACVSGHRSWSSLQRYSHIRQSGDKFQDWPWLSVVTDRVPSQPQQSAGLDIPQDEPTPRL